MLGKEVPMAMLRIRSYAGIVVLRIRPAATSQAPRKGAETVTITL